MDIFKIFRRPEIKVGQRWTYKRDNPFEVTPVVTVIEIRGDWLRYRIEWTYPSTVIPRPSITETNCSRTFRDYYPIFISDGK